MALRSVCVYAGSNPGEDPRFVATARALGALLAERTIRLVYGGGRVGLMGAVADAALAAGGSVTGVIPEALDRREVAHRGLDDLRVVDSMHARKALMAELADGFVALPGGIGTIEELVEAATWTQLGLHAKAVVLLDGGGYWEPLAAMLDGAVEAGFLRSTHRSLVQLAPSPEAALSAIETWQPPQLHKWVELDDV